MAKVITDTITIHLSKLVKDNHDGDNVLSNGQVESLTGSIPELIESIVDDESIVVEVVIEGILSLQ